MAGMSDHRACARSGSLTVWLVVSLAALVSACTSSSATGMHANTSSNVAPATSAEQPYTPPPAPATSEVAPASGGAENTRCEQFSTMDPNEQATVVEEMLEEMHQTGWGVGTVLPNVRAMCASYPPNTPISVTMTG